MLTFPIIVQGVVFERSIEDAYEVDDDQVCFVVACDIHPKFYQFMTLL